MNESCNAKPAYGPARDPGPPWPDAGSAIPLQALLNAIPYPVFYKDLEGRFLGCNQAFERSRNLSRRELLGKTVFHLLSAEEAGSIHRKDQELLAGGGQEVFQAMITGPDQTLRQVLVTKAVYQVADGVPGGILTTVMDVTKQKEAEEALRRSQDLLATIGRNILDLITITDLHGRRLYTSPSYLPVLGYGPEQLEAMSPMALVHPQDQRQVQAFLHEVLRSNAPQTAEFRLRHRDGRWLDFEARGNPVQPASGRVAEVLFVTRDVTRRKAAERERQLMEVQLRHAQKLESIGSLAAGIAHEINTPTQYIGDNATFLGSTLPDLLACARDLRRYLQHPPAGPEADALAAALLGRLEALDLDYLAEEVPRAVQQSLEGVARVSAIVSAMKDFSHPDGADKTLVNLNQAIESTLLVARNEWKYVARLETDLDPGLPPVPCHPGEVNQAVLNLVVNAAQAIEEALGGRHTGRLGLIQVTTRLEGGEVRISVADTGTGIPEAIRDRIFEPFFTTKPVGKGTGQGLAIVRGVVVEKHHGRVAVASEPGRGTTFHLHLPLAAPGPGQEA